MIPPFQRFIATLEAAASKGPRVSAAIAISCVAVLGANHFNPHLLEGWPSLARNTLWVVAILFGTMAFVQGLPIPRRLPRLRKSPVPRAGYFKRRSMDKKLRNLNIDELSHILVPLCKDTRSVFLNTDSIHATRLQRKGILEAYLSPVITDSTPDYLITRTAWEQMQELEEFRVASPDKLIVAVNHLLAARRSARMWRTMLQVFPQQHPAVIQELKRLDAE